MYHLYICISVRVNQVLISGKKVKVFCLFYCLKNPPVISVVLSKRVSPNYYWSIKLKILSNHSKQKQLQKLIYAEYQGTWKTWIICKSHTSFCGLEKSNESHGNLPFLIWLRVSKILNFWEKVGEFFFVYTFFPFL